MAVASTSVNNPAPPSSGEHLPVEAKKHTDHSSPLHSLDSCQCRHRPGTLDPESQKGQLRQPDTVEIRKPVVETNSNIFVLPYAKILRKAIAFYRTETIVV